MTPLDRVFLGICAIVLVVLAGFIIAAVLGSAVLLEWLSSPSLGFDGSILAIILLLLAVYWWLWPSVRSQEVHRLRQGSGFSTHQRRVCGSLIVEAASQIIGVEQVRASFSDVVDPKVTLKVTAYPDHNLGELSEEVQETVKAYVEKTVEL